MSMQISQKRLIAIIAILIVAIGSTTTWYMTRPEPERVVPDEAIDVTLDFYNSWLAIRKDTAKDKVQGLNEIGNNVNEALKNELSGKVATLQNDSVDPILCINYVPEKVGAKIVYEATTTAEIMIIPRGVETPLASPAIVSLSKEGEFWKIIAINCSSGEVAPEREYSFMMSGRLLKNVPPPLNPEFWHLVYEQDGVGGYTAPLLFASTSLCSFNNEEAIPCDTARLYETASVRIEGNMTEAGVDVVRLTEIIPGE